MDPEFKALLDTLNNSSDAGERADAARKLGNYVDDLNDEEYELAKAALNKALADPDPTVLMAAMQSITKYDRIGAGDIDIHGDTPEDLGVAEQGTSCSVCGRPEALIPEGGCERDDCPYN